MPNPQSNEKQVGKYQQGSGSEYHKEHASHVPDYGQNIIDPNAKGLGIKSNNEEGQ